MRKIFRALHGGFSRSERGEEEQRVVIVGGWGGLGKEKDKSKGGGGLLSSREKEIRGDSDTLVSRYRRRGEEGDVFTAGCSQGSFQQVSSSVSHNTLTLLPPGFLLHCGKLPLLQV